LKKKKENYWGGHRRADLLEEKPGEKRGKKGLDGTGDSRESGVGGFGRRNEARKLYRLSRKWERLTEGLQFNDQKAQGKGGEGGSREKETASPPAVQSKWGEKKREQRLDLNENGKSQISGRG